VASKQPQTSSNSINTARSNWIQRLSWHGFHLALVAFSIYLLVVLATFDARDPTSTQAFDVSNINNAGGTFGAVLADLFFWALGLIAYLIPILIIQYEVTRFIGQSRYAQQDPHNSVWFKMLSFSALIIAACVYASIHMTNTNLAYPQTSGGLLGVTLGLPLHQALGMTGTNILVLTTLMLATSQFWQLRWGRITETIGRHSIYWFQHVCQSLFGEGKQLRQAKAAQNTYTRASSKAPRPSILVRPLANTWRYLVNLWPSKRGSLAGSQSTSNMA
jgi:S-DNA-T family DNA segregation ATPase FtsK/SpoIIIE